MLVQGATTKTRASRRRPRPTPNDLLLDGFFEAWSRAHTGKLASAIYKGHVTGAALALKLKWTRDKVSRRTDELRSGGIVAKRRNNGWMKTTLTTEGVEAARRWARLPQANPPSDPPPPAWTDEERMRASGALASGDRRRLLNQLATTPGSTQADLVASCGLPQPTASRALRELEAAGFLEGRLEDGRTRLYVQAAALERLNAWLNDYVVRLAEGARRSEAVVLPRAGKRPAETTASTEAPVSSLATGAVALHNASPVDPGPHELNDNELLDDPGEVSEPADPSTPDAADAA